MLARTLLLLAALAAPAVAQDRPAPPARIGAIAWMQGLWEGEGLGGRIQEVWMPARDGVMLGAFRLMKPDGKGFYELFAVEEHAGSLRFVVKHFNPDFVGWEEKGEAQRFPLTAVGESEARFGGFLFRREPGDVLTIAITMRGRDGGTREETVRLRRAPL